MADGIWFAVSRVLRLALRLAIVIAIFWLAHRLFAWFEVQIADTGADMHMALTLSAYVAYAVLIAIPFVPGIELAVAAMIMRGPEVAPAIYLATLAGLMLAFLVGQTIPASWLSRTCADLGLKRSGTALERFAALPAEARLEALRAALPRWLGRAVTKFRYLLLAALINVPGSSLIGGGGGIMLMTGLTRLYAPHWVFLTLALAIAPVPLAVWTLGPGILDRFGLH